MTREPSEQDVNRRSPVSCDSEDSSAFPLRPKISADELERWLDELSAGQPGKVLPSDFSRADIYDEHD
jgi:hypothetical protein